MKLRFFTLAGNIISVVTVLFICVHNAGRSQMAEAFLNKLSEGRHRGLSAGSRPSEEVNPINTLASDTWRVVYYNSQDKVILNAIEVSTIPEVACAAAEDLADTQERLHEVLQWVAQS